jgi:hypothetical protein
MSYLKANVQEFKQTDVLESFQMPGSLVLDVHVTLQKQNVDTLRLPKIWGKNGTFHAKIVQMLKK